MAGLPDNYNYLKPSGYYIYHSKLVTAFCSYEFSIIVAVNSD
jgi:hypothetical protein